MRKILLFSIICIISKSVISDPIFLNIRIFSNELIDSVRITPQVDGYLLVLDDSAQIELMTNTEYLLFVMRV